jgi:hypothetical protein
MDTWWRNRIVAPRTPDRTDGVPPTHGRSLCHHHLRQASLTAAILGANDWSGSQGEMIVITLPPDA